MEATSWSAVKSGEVVVGGLVITGADVVTGGEVVTGGAVVDGGDVVVGGEVVVGGLVVTGGDVVTGGEVVLGAEVGVVLQMMFAHKLGSDVLVASLGCDTPVVHRTTALVVAFHSQQGSPSSWPFVWPSPSVSAIQRATVHFFPALEKALPKALVADDLPVPSVCPIAGTPATFPPFGIRAT
ncbi:unnamed protein product [Phytophthora fragariaefolia]|uniref:Unnamed protein product n=1 Tax=Phytophthora fragariaefolia TaxID=1490495 RepID=A0A9W6YE96_9STRA|nr:unnamed protein product [Phytophthora fragariaefolia]